MGKLDFYKSKRVLVTGHTGFKGAWLTLWLKELGADVLGYSLEPPTNPNLFDALKLEDKINHVIGDVRDDAKLLSTFQDFQPELVFHLAAQPLVRLSYKEPKLTYETNVLGVVNILEAVRKTSSVRVVVNVTSDKCYEFRELPQGYKETDPIGGYDPYSSSKGCAEIITSAFRRSYFEVEKFSEHNVSLSSVRAGNVIGGGDWGEDRLVPDCIKALSKNETINIRYPHAVRPWQHALDPLSGYLWLGALMHRDGAKYSGAWNIGPDYKTTLTVEEVVKLIIKIFGKGKYTIDNSNHPHEASLLKLDCGKAKEILKWEAVYDVHEAVDETMKWYKAFYCRPSNNANLYNLSCSQINHYKKKAEKKGLEWSL